MLEYSSIMEKTILKATKREAVGKGIKELRKEGLIPAVVYGRGKENINLSVFKIEFDKVIREAGTSQILLLSVGDEKKNVLIHDISYNPITSAAQHIDFYEISMTEKITTNVPLHFVGDSVAVIEMGGTLVTNKDEVEVECLPANLPHEIEVDIAPLVDFEATIHVSGLKLPEGVEVKDDPEEVVASIEPPRSEEELAELEEQPEEIQMPESEHGGEEESAEEGTEEEKTE